VGCQHGTLQTGMFDLNSICTERNSCYGYSYTEKGCDDVEGAGIQVDRVERDESGGRNVPVLKREHFHICVFVCMCTFSMCLWRSPV
jgi:hypothetical protein